MSLTLRPFGPADEGAALAAVEEFYGSGFEFLPFGYTKDMPFAEWIALMERHRQGLDLPENYVRNAFLAADVEGQLVGRVSIRFALNDFLATRGGHIGYGVIQAFRRRGYATAILRRAIEIARAEDVGRLLITCDDDNTGSITVIERCGGVLEAVVLGDDSVAYRRYWI